MKSREDIFVGRLLLRDVRACSSEELDNKFMNIRLYLSFLITQVRDVTRGLLISLSFSSSFVLYLSCLYTRVSWRILGYF